MTDGYVNGRRLEIEATMAALRREAARKQGEIDVLERKRTELLKAATFLAEMATDMEGHR